MYYTYWFCPVFDIAIAGDSPDILRGEPVLVRQDHRLGASEKQVYHHQLSHSIHCIIPRYWIVPINWHSAFRFLATLRLLQDEDDINQVCWAEMIHRTGPVWKIMFYTFLNILWIAKLINLHIRLNSKRLKFVLSSRPSVDFFRSSIELDS